MIQYKVLQASILINEKQLNTLGQEGWNLVTIIAEGKSYYFYFAKQVLH